MTLEKIIEFNYEARKILQLGFSRYLQENKSIGITIGGKSNPGVTVQWPSEDSTRSFMLLLRLLIRDGKEKISFRCLREYYTKINIPDDYKETYYNIHDSLNKYLDSNTRTTYVKIPNLTNRDLLNTFLWGEYAHIEDPYKTRLREWKDLIPWPELQRELRIVLWEILDYIEVIIKINEQIIDY